MGSAPSWQRFAFSARLHASIRTGRTNKVWHLAKNICCPNLVFRFLFRMLLAAGGENPHESWVVALKEDGPLKARLVVQGFTDRRPTASRRHRQIFLTTVASLWFQIHKGDVKCSFQQGDLANNVDDDNDDIFKIESAQLVSDTFSLRHQFPSCLESCNWSITSSFAC